MVLNMDSHNGRILLMTKPGCPFCRAIKKELTEFLFEKRLSPGFREEVYDPERVGYEQRKAALVAKTGWRTFPQLFVDGVFRGGYTDFVLLRDSGRLAGLLRQDPR